MAIYGSMPQYNQQAGINPQMQYPYQMPQGQSMAAPQMQQMPQTPQIQNGGFVSVPNEEIARTYPIAPGNSITFKDENAPYIYTKTMGFSQLDRPTFEKYRLVREEERQIVSQVPEERVSRDDLQGMKDDIASLWVEFRNLRRLIEKGEDEEE